MNAKFHGDVKLLGRCVIGKESTPVLWYDLWQFTASPGSRLNNVNLIFDSSSTPTQINWGNGSIEMLTSNTNYNHIFS